MLRDTRSQNRLDDETRDFEIRFLPLSEHYQVLIRETGSVKTFPRLRHVLAELSRVEISFHTGVIPAGDYELLVRVRMDPQKLPPPMRLPVLLSAKWQHESAWSSWPLVVAPGA